MAATGSVSAKDVLFLWQLHIIHEPIIIQTSEGPALTQCPLRNYISVPHYRATQVFYDFCSILLHQRALCRSRLKRTFPAQRTQRTRRSALSMFIDWLSQKKVVDKERNLVRLTELCKGAVVGSERKGQKRRRQV